jgi:hypothetical protein
MWIYVSEEVADYLMLDGFDSVRLEEIDTFFP